MSKEIWKDISGHEGNYQVSNMGRVRSLDRIVKTKYYNIKFKGKILSSYCANKNEYIKVPLGRNVTKKVHTVVTLAFLGPPLWNQEVRHKDGNKHNAKLSNLQYGTKSENEKDKIHQGKTKISVSQIKKLKSFKGLKTYKELANIFSISESYVNHILNNRSHGDIL